jgi:hypothetical protein
MSLRDDVVRSLKAPLFYISGALIVLAVTLLSAALGWKPWEWAVAALALWALASFVLIQSKLGATAIVRARDRERALSAERANAQAQLACERLARLRLPDEDLIKTRDYVAQSAGEYLAAAKRQKTHSPVAAERIADSLQTIDLYLKEIDEAATEKRYGLKDSDPFADAKVRVENALLENARVLREERIRIDGGLPPALAFEAKEELK